MDYQEHVEYLLKNYKALTSERKEFLKLLTLNPILTEEDAIEVLAFKKTEQETFKEGCHSDKTPNIALNFMESMTLLTPQERDKLKTVIKLRSKELYTLQSAVNSLCTLEQQTIKKLYFEGKTYRQVSKSLSISESTLSRYRKKALEAMAEFFKVMDYRG